MSLRVDISIYNDKDMLAANQMPIAALPVPVAVLVRMPVGVIPIGIGMYSGPTVCSFSHTFSDGVTLLLGMRGGDASGFVHSYWDKDAAEKAVQRVPRIASRPASSARRSPSASTCRNTNYKNRWTN